MPRGKLLEANKPAWTPHILFWKLLYGTFPVNWTSEKTRVWLCTSAERRTSFVQLYWKCEGRQVPIRPTPSYATGFSSFILSCFVSLVPLGCEIVVWA